MRYCFRPATCAFALTAVVGMLTSGPARAGEPLRVYAAGSLSAAFTEMVAKFPGETDAVAPPVFGPSGVLRTKIEGGAAADILASADMAQPDKLAAERGGRPVVMFTRNRMCALARPALALTASNMLEKLLDPKTRLATSTPGADPGGDYAWAVFSRADVVHPGARAILEAKAQKLVGGADSPLLVPGHGAVAGVFLADKADVMLGYCSGSEAVIREVPGLVSVALPPDLTVGPAYGMVVLSDDPAAFRFAVFVMSETGQAILARHGFDPVGVP